MTDIIFLLLIFFMLTSTVVVPNGIKVNLPQGKAKVDSQPIASITIKNENDLTYYFQWGSDAPKAILESQIGACLDDYFADNAEKYVALYVDEGVLYSEVVKVLDIANSKKYKMVLATRPPKTK